MDATCNYEESNIASTRPLQNQTFNNVGLSTDMCKYSNYSDSLGIMNVSFSHNTSMIKLRIRTNYYNQSSANSNPYMFWGFKNMLIVVGQCAPNCLTCNSSSPKACLSCATNYVLNSSGSCNCDTTRNNYYLSQCLPKCESDSLAVMYNQTCMPCQHIMTNCRRCTNYSRCIECLEGSYLNSDG